MNHWLKLFLTIALAISIPLQGFAGIAMPVCNMSKDTMGASMVMSSAHNDTTMSQSDVIAGNGDMIDKNCGDMTGNKTCPDQKCSMCHTSILQLPNASLLTVPEIIATTYLDLINDNYQTFPPGLFHPPKHLFS